MNIIFLLFALISSTTASTASEYHLKALRDESTTRPTSSKLQLLGKWQHTGDDEHLSGDGLNLADNYFFLSFYNVDSVDFEEYI